LLLLLGYQLELVGHSAELASKRAFIFCMALMRCTFTVASAMPISLADEVIE